MGKAIVVGEGGEGIGGGLDFLIKGIPVERVVHVKYHVVVGTVGIHGVSLQKSKARIEQIYKGGSGLHWES